MDDKTYNLVMEILKADIPKETKDEIVRFYTLPRNTPVKPKIESGDVFDPDEQVGPVRRPSAKEIEKQENPHIAAEDEEMKKTIDAINERAKQDK